LHNTLKVKEILHRMRNQKNAKFVCVWYAKEKEKEKIW